MHYLQNYVMNKILTGLYLGNIRDSRDHEQLKANLITHIISIHDTAKSGPFQEIQYLCVNAADTPSQNLIQYFAQCNDFIHSARLSGGNVLVHCLAGVSRSVTIIAAYLSTITTLGVKEVLNAIKAVRNISGPNPGFCKQLQDFESFKLKHERNRLCCRFAETIPNLSDEEELKKLAASFRLGGNTRSSKSWQTWQNGSTRVDFTAQSKSMAILCTPKCTRHRVGSTSSMM